MTAHTADLKESLFEEIKGRLKEDDEWFLICTTATGILLKNGKDESYPIITAARMALKL
jgi:oligopeptidase B